MNRLLLILIGILLLLCVAMGIHLSILHGKLKLSGQYKGLYESIFTPPTTWQAKDSTWHSNVSTVTVTDPSVVRELQGLKEQVEGLKHNMKNFEGYHKIATETTIRKTIELRDSSFSYTTRYDTIRGTLDGDSVHLLAKITVPLDVVDYWSRNWFLGKKKRHTEIISRNPNARIIVNKSIEKEKRRKIF
jgi:hypothetical protein